MNRRVTEQELADVNESLSDATVANQAIAAAKRKLDSELQTLHGDFDEMSAEARLCEEKSSKAMVDAAKLADELRAEQEAAQGIERNRKLGESQLKDMQGRFDEAETNALKGGKKAVNKLDTRIRGLERGRKLGESQLKDMQGRFDEAETNALKGGKKAVNKLDTRIRELESELDAENRRFA